MHIAVTGAGGFVGAALVRVLRRRERGHVVALMRPAFDLLDRSSFRAIPHNVDVLVHAAGLVGEGHKPEALWSHNVVATHALVDYLAELPRPPYLLFVSTGGVNGPSAGLLQAASEPRPRDIYALTKYLGEEVIRHRHAGAWGVARIYFPYGRGQAAARLIPRLAESILAGQPVRLNRGGRPLVSPIYVDDLAHLLARMVKRRERRIQNLAGPDAVTIRELALRIGAQLGAEPRFEESDEPALDMAAASLPDITYTSLDDGLRVTFRALGA